MGGYIKQEAVESTDMSPSPEKDQGQERVVSLSSSNMSSDFSGISDEDQLDVESNPKNKKQRVEAVLPVGFLDPIRPAERPAPEKRDVAVSASTAIVPVEEESGGRAKAVTTVALKRNCKQFWKAGDYEECSNGRSVDVSDGDMDHVRVHPRFLHSNATSHKWALGAFAELLDNALDEVCNGATYVNVDLLENIKDKNKMVLVQDNGGGMTPDKMRQCMSLGYSAKSKMVNTIGQYGNGFKTSTMRLGADVIVFSRCQGKFGDRATQSIGMLSYTFLQNTGKEDIMVPMIDYEKTGETWSKRVRSSSACWQTNLEAIVQWSPYESEEDLLHQFDFLEDQGTRIVIYNLWEDDQGLLELDFDNDQYDIQIRDGNRDKKIIDLAALRPSAKSFLTYRFSLRSYNSILYRRIPPGFRIILRGNEVMHHDLVNDMNHVEELVYKPLGCEMSAAVKLGFIRDAEHHIDIQGFNVYHKNRLIKPFWRVWNAAGSDGRGVIGVLEANFVEPAHDKQGFERTTALSRLEARLIHLQKNYWSSKCQLIGYAQRRNKSASAKKEASPIANDTPGSKAENTRAFTTKSKGNNLRKPPGFTAQFGVKNEQTSSPLYVEPLSECPPGEPLPVKRDESNRDGQVVLSPLTDMVLKLNEERHSLRRSLEKVSRELQYEKDKNKSLQEQLHDSAQMIRKMDREQEVFVSSFAEERSRRDEEEQNMRRRLKEASETIEALLNKVKRLEAATGLH